MQFPTLVRRVGVVRHELVFLLGPEVELVGVVRDVHLFFADQLVVEAVLAAGEHLQFVEQGDATLAGHRGIEGEFRR
ncbi:hypothetical protein D9M71_521230 [compost metagenome]